MNGRSRPKAAPKTPATASESTVDGNTDRSTDGAPDQTELPLVTGVERAGANASDWWWSPAWRAMKWMANTGQPFECWDLTQLGVPDPDSPARWGALFGAAAKAGVIQQHGYTRSRRPGRASGVTRTWVGVR